VCFIGISTKWSIIDSELRTENSIRTPGLLAIPIFASGQFSIDLRLNVRDDSRASLTKGLRPTALKLCSHIFPLGQHNHPSARTLTHEAREWMPILAP